MKFKFASLIPKKSSDWVIVISGVIYLTIHITIIIFFSMTWLAMGESEPLEQWLLRGVRDVFFIIFITSMIVFGIREVRHNGKTFENFTRPLIGVIWCISVVFISWRGETVISDFNNSLGEKSSLYNLEKKLESPDLPIDKKTRVSALYAKMYYYYHGEQIKYLTRDGTYALYQPTEKEKEKHKYYAGGMKTTTWLMRSMHRTKYLWLSVLVISLLLGFMTPIKKVKT